MNLFNFAYYLPRMAAIFAIATLTLAGCGLKAQADYDPPGGKPPTVRTSTSGMQL